MTTTPFPRAPLVLVAEDDPEAAALIEDILCREGCEVLLASDGAQALEIARELPRPDLVLLDLELPIMDGRAFLETLRADSSLSSIPVVVVSGAADAEAVRATDNVRKAALLDGLRRVLGRLRGEKTTVPETVGVLPTSEADGQATIAAAASGASAAP